MDKKTDTFDMADTISARRAACGYCISTLTCAACANVRHKDGWCIPGGFHVNLDRGFCKKFKFITRGHEGRVTLPSRVGASVPLARKTITRRTK